MVEISPSGSTIPGLVLVNGKVITVDKRFSIAQAVAIQNGNIIAVGRNEEVKQFIGRDTTIIDLKGKTVLPGIIDAHIHAALYGGTRPPFLLDVGYPEVNSISDIGKVVRNKIKKVRPGEWIRGTGWNEGYLEECTKNPERHPGSQDLNDISPDNPVSLVDFSGHTLWVNSKALELAGITNSKPSPSGGEIVKDPKTGAPTGILKELAAGGLIMKVMSPWSKKQKREAILSTLKELNSFGITSITEGALGPGGTGYQGGLLDAECIRIYSDLCREGNLTVRISVMLLFGEYGSCSFKDLQKGFNNNEPLTSFDTEWLRMGGVKIFADGVTGSKSAWMHEDYIGGGRGQLVLPGETEEARYNELINMILLAHKHGFQLGIHAVGDRAVDACVDGFIKAEQEEPRDLRHHIIHGAFISDQCAKRMAEYNIGVNVQPLLKTTVSHLVDNVVGKERSAGQFPLRNFIGAGIPVAASSDAPVTHPDWKQGMESAVLRESKATGKVSGPEQCITREEAIRAYTIEGARQNHMDHLLGSIEVGKLADFCILDGDILTVDAHQIKNIPTLMTIVGGQIVYNEM